MPIALPRKLLVPTDFSEHAAVALDYACALAAKLDAQIFVLHVVTLPVLDVAGTATASMTDVLTDAGQQQLAKLLAAHCTAALGSGLLRVGGARAIIETVARELDIDLIVMGSHGHHGFRRLVLGSVAEAIVRTAPCPVLTVHLPSAA